MKNRKNLTLYFATWLLSAVCAVTPFLALASAQTPGTCLKGENDVALESDVGKILQGICSECYEVGDCSVTDIMTVFANVGNYVLGIIAGLVFLMYIVGGVFWLGSRGDKAWVEKGKKYVKNSTIGLLIVLFAYVGVQTLQRALESGDVGGEATVICDGSSNTEGKLCGEDKTCVEGQCTSACARKGATWACTENTAEYDSCDTSAALGCAEGEACCDTTTIGIGEKEEGDIDFDSLC
jgi:hypothetical protein